MQSGPCPPPVPTRTAPRQRGDLSVAMGAPPPSPGLLCDTLAASEIRSHLTHQKPASASYACCDRPNGSRNVTSLPNRLSWSNPPESHSADRLAPAGIC